MHDARRNDQPTQDTIDLSITKFFRLPGHLVITTARWLDEEGTYVLHTSTNLCRWPRSLGLCFFVFDKAVYSLGGMSPIWDSATSRFLSATCGGAFSVVASSRSSFSTTPGK
eukprot:GHVS01068967.1.p1 GENE.GHVS01068967.1~~GHVS01068967.1.p1  ORF type:complete len:112 (-),score=0.80 GHVS01068967.1:1110-1445(-)